MTKKQQKRKIPRRKQKVEELFEPEELQRGYLTETDINIRQIDKPERFQVRLE
jgi:hypothetical protein